MSLHATFFLFALLSVALSSRVSEAAIITFNEFGLEHGSIVDTQFSGLPFFLTIRGFNSGEDLGPAGDVDLAITFDSSRTNTRDGDLEGPPPRPWAGGNITTRGVDGANTVLGNLLIIAENDTDSNNDGIIDLPDDEGSKPAGTLEFDFTAGPGITSFGITLVDIENNAETSGHLATFFQGTTEIGEVDFAAFANASLLGGIFFDNTVDFGGDNTANILNPVTIDQLNTAFSTSFSSFDRVEVFFNGSGAIGELNFSPVPEPASLVMWCIGAFGVLGCSWWRNLRRRASRRSDREAFACE